ncbi:MAG: hypothetical protein WKF89_06405 [Chitinophagaceae bacterium]
MSKCNFTITFPGTTDDVLAKTRTAIEEQGGEFMGDVNSGTFNVQVMGLISGTYQISGQMMNIEIDSKPMFIPCSQIESFMKSKFGGG